MAALFINSPRTLLMDSPESRILRTGKRTLELEASAILSLVGSIREEFAQCVRLLAGCKGRVIVTGIGKSAIIARKISATFNSTGTPALFLHAGDALHGDLGMIQPEDLVLCLSQSGESPEIKVLIPLLRGFRVPLIALTGNRNSTLALQADLALDTSVSQEACPNNLAPTASTTAQLAMGDALAVCLMEWKGFSSADFARIHPGGTLGKKLYLHVSDLCVHNARPSVREDSSLREVIISISSGRLGVTVVLDPQDRLRGVITDGDLRRMLEREISMESLKASEIMSGTPKTIAEDALAVEALTQMRQYNITQLIVMQEGNYSGIIHLHDLVREGLI